MGREPMRDRLKTYMVGACRERGVSWETLSNAANKNLKYFRDSANGRPGKRTPRNPPADILQLVAPVLDVDPVQLLIEAEYLTPEQIKKWIAQSQTARTRSVPEGDEAGPG